MEEQQPNNNLVDDSELFSFVDKDEDKAWSAEWVAETTTVNVRDFIESDEFKLLIIDFFWVKKEELIKKILAKSENSNIQKWTDHDLSRSLLDMLEELKKHFYDHLVWLLSIQEIPIERKEKTLEKISKMF